MDWARGFMILSKRADNFKDIKKQGFPPCFFNSLFASPIFVSAQVIDFDDQQGLSQPISLASLDMLATNALKHLSTQL